MNDIRIPPHLKIAEAVSKGEYERARVQSKVVLITAMSVGIIFSIPLIIIFSIWIGLPLAGLSSVLTERIMNVLLKDAHKAKTHRMKKYKELAAFKERHGLS